MSIRSLNWLKFGGLVALAFVLGLFFAGLLDFPKAGFAQERSGHTPIVKVDAPRIPAARPLVDLSDAYAAIVDAVRPSVVYIQSERPGSASDQGAQIFGSSSLTLLSHHLRDGKSHAHAIAVWSRERAAKALHCGGMIPQGTQRLSG